MISPLAIFAALVWTPVHASDLSAAGPDAALSHPDPDTRAALLWDVAQAPAEIAAPVLRAALEHPDATTRGAAVRAMGRTAPEYATDLLIALGDPHAGVRTAAVKAAGATEDPATFAALRKCLRDRDAVVRRYAIDSLCKLDPERAAMLPALIRLVVDPDEAVAEAARAGCAQSSSR